MANPVLQNGMASPVSIFETVNTPVGHAIGSRGILDDRVFRWTKFTSATAIGANKLAQAAAPIATEVSETGTLTGMTTVGNSRITAVIGAADVPSDKYRDGYFKIESATTGAGQIYRVKGHAFVATTGTMTFDLFDPVVTATSGTTTWSLIQNPWADVVIQPTSITAPAVGVPHVTWAANTTTTGTSPTPPAGYVTTSVSGATYTYTTVQYGWVQTWGLCSVLIDTTNIVAGSGVIVGAVAGSVGLAVETDIKDRVGIAHESLSTDNAYASIFLKIAP